jgi:hypothetical protein
MKSICSTAADYYRTGKKKFANPNNSITTKRKNLFEKIKSSANGNISNEILLSMNIIKPNRDKIEQYVISQGESPAENIQHLIKQAYDLRSKQVDSVAASLGISDGEAIVTIEQDEDFQRKINNYSGGGNIGELFAPIGIAAKYLSHGGGDNFNLSSVTSVVGEKIDKSALIRAAQNKKPGIIGSISGKRKYEQLRSYLNSPENIKEKEAVLKGIITDVSELKNFNPLNESSGVKVLAKDVIDQLKKNEKKKELNKIIPYAIIGVIIIILISVIITKYAGNSSK